MLLTAGEATLHVLPEAGGSAAGWTWQGSPVMRPATADDLAAGQARRSGAYPLIPFSGRIAEGRFMWRGREIALPHNFPPETVAIHGDAWEQAWTIAEQGPSHVRLTLDHAAQPSWPFPYWAELGFTLLPDGLDVAIHLRAGEAMPAGLGWHPYFHRTAEAALGFTAARVWIADEANIPAREEAPSGPLRFDPLRPLGPAHVDNCYAGWSHRAELHLDHARLELEADPVFDHLVVYTPAGRDFFCTEPATHAPNAVNRPGGMRVLDKGETLAGTIRLRLFPR